MDLAKTESVRRGVRSSGGSNGHRARLLDYDTWRRRQRGKLAALAAVSVFACLPLGHAGLEAMVACCALLAFSLWVAAVHRGHGLLLRVLVDAGATIEMSRGRLERHIDRARDTKVRACVIACLAEHELYRGDPSRGRALFVALAERGWHPERLASGWTRMNASVLDAAATMATQQALDGSLADAERASAALRSADERGSTLLLRAVLLMRRGRLRDAADVLERARRCRSIGTSGCRDAVALTRAFVHTKVEGAPYRGIDAQSPRPLTRTSLDWLSERLRSLGSRAC